jgi:hypothetical protein
MGNISLKINLRQLKHVEREMKGQGDKMIKCLIIPLEENMIYQGEKGAYLNLTAIEIKDRSKFSADQKDTHLIKQDVPKDKYEAMTEEQRKAMPIIGNAILWGRQESAPVESAELSNSAIDAYNENKEEDDGLPF